MRTSPLHAYNPPPTTPPPPGSSAFIGEGGRGVGGWGWPSPGRGPLIPPLGRRAFPGAPWRAHPGAPRIPHSSPCGGASVHGARSAACGPARPHRAVRAAPRAPFSPRACSSSSREERPSQRFPWPKGGGRRGPPPGSTTLASACEEAEGACFGALGRPREGAAGGSTFFGACGSCVLLGAPAERESAGALDQTAAAAGAAGGPRGAVSPRRAWRACGAGRARAGEGCDAVGGRGAVCGGRGDGLPTIPNRLGEQAPGRGRGRAGRRVGAGSNSHPPHSSPQGRGRQRGPCRLCLTTLSGCPCPALHPPLHRPHRRHQLGRPLQRVACAGRVHACACVRVRVRARVRARGLGFWGGGERSVTGVRVLEGSQGPGAHLSRRPAARARRGAGRCAAARPPAPRRPSCSGGS
jgi:hypothetical protein